MTTDPIIESGMAFGPYADGYCFHIEKSTTYQKIQDGIKIAEFLLIHPKNGQTPIVWVVEAKSSTPRPENALKFDEFIGEIREKLTNGFSLGIAMCLLRHKSAEAELPEPFKLLNLSNVDFRLILVVNGHQELWLPPLQEALIKALHSTIKTWALSPTSVAVINDSMAQQNGLIFQNIDPG